MHQIKLNRYHCSFKDKFFTKLLLMTVYYYLYSDSSILNRCSIYVFFNYIFLVYDVFKITYMSNRFMPVRTGPYALYQGFS
jgi:hypothetical protein